MLSSGGLFWLLALLQGERRAQHTLRPGGRGSNGRHGRWHQHSPGPDVGLLSPRPWDGAGRTSTKLAGAAAVFAPTTPRGRGVPEAGEELQGRAAMPEDF